ncbi:MAG TPA: DegT/DnrJ/EryC1/StrS family aminotransferase [Pirellulales bacterium]|jgi:dTDP-4-amino-4,6-dideoxygalactose transaminase|nr:DegT/DnrJ/EryC1/StrS family aminotransferase [Pirellulales bacterium]
MATAMGISTNLPAILGGQPAFEQLVPIVRPTLPPFSELSTELAEIVTSGMVTRGRHLRAFEEAAAEHLRVKHAVAVSSCTTGLMLTYQGLGLTGDIIVPSFTFMATISAAVWAGLRPVMVDVERHTHNIDPAAIEQAITPATRAIVAVHNFGNPADIAALEQIAKRRNLKLVFDAAHGFGARFQGVPVGPQGDAHVYSLSPTKLVVAGEGGIVATNSDELAEKIRCGREYGMGKAYDSLFAGINARMSEFHACLGRHSLVLLEKHASRRQEIVALFRRELGRLPGIGFQEVLPGNRCSYKDFSLTVDSAAFGLSRDGLAKALTAENIDTRKYYDPPAHRQTAYRQFAPPAGQLKVTDLLAASCLSLPLWSHLTDEIALQICRACQRIHDAAEDVKTHLAAQ